MGGLVGRDQSGGQVAAANILLQRTRDIGFHSSWQKIGHGGFISDKTG
jgi:hypothetical protein